MGAESNLQTNCIKYLKSKGIYHINVHGGGWSAKGAPDLVVCIGGRFVAFELKVGENDLQDDQIVHRARLRRNGGLHYAPYTLEEFIKIVEELENGR